MGNVFNSIFMFIISLCGAATKGAQALETSMSAVHKVATVGDINAQRFVDEAKHINDLRLKEMDNKIQKKFKTEQSQWDI